MGINILVLTFEYDAFTFSGNGVYAQSLVRGLEMQEGVSVDVVCGGPFGAENCQPPSKAAVVVNLPRWGHLDASCCFICSIIIFIAIYNSVTVGVFI